MKTYLPWSTKAIADMLRFAGKNSGPWDDFKDGEDYPGEEHAPLLAASPDLLQALLAMECGACHLQMDERYNKPCPDCAPAFAAIDKAIGGPS